MPHVGRPATASLNGLATPHEQRGLRPPVQGIFARGENAKFRFVGISRPEAHFYALAAAEIADRYRGTDDDGRFALCRGQFQPRCETDDALQVCEDVLAHPSAIVAAVARRRAEAHDAHDYQRLHVAARLGDSILFRMTISSERLEPERSKPKLCSNASER